MEENLVKLSYLTSMLKQETDCAICLQTLKDPITTKCMHNFCNACISRVIKGNKSTVCPLCNSPIFRRGTATNVKIQNIIKKISPIIESIKNDSSVEILSYYKGKATPSLADGAAKMGSVDLAEVNCNGADRSHPLSKSIIDVTDTSGSTSKSKGSRMSNACDNGISLVKEEQVSFHNFDSLSEVEHLSASQNVPKTHSKKISVDVPVSGNVKSPAKKVTEWLTKNSTNDCLSSNVHGHVHEVAEKLSTDDENEADDSKREADASKDELHVNRSFGSRSKRKVYKGIKKSKLDLKNRNYMSSKREMSIEYDLDHSNEEKDIIQDSCPVEINDTFDKLVSSARHNISCDAFSPLAEETENQNNSIGLFESLPMPNYDNASKRKRTSKKLKLDTSGDLIPGLNSEKYTKKKLNYRKGGTGVYDKRSGGTDDRNNLMNDSNPRIGEDIVRGESDDGTEREVSGTSCQEKMKEGITSLNFNRSITYDSDMALAKPGKRRLDISTPKWPHFDNTLKDFQESRKVILPVLDVSVGDPHKASKNQQKLRKTSSGSLEKVPCNHLVDLENSFVQSVISEGVISPKTTADAKNMPEVMTSVIQESSFVPALKRPSYPRKNKKAEVTVSCATSGRETVLPISKKKVDIGHVDVQPTNDSFNYAHESIDMNKTSDEPPKNNKGENPQKGILTLHVQSLENNFQCPSVKSMEDQSISPTHRKKSCSPVEKCIDNAKITVSEKVENQLILKPKKLVPFLKLRRLSDKKCQGPRVKFLTLGNLRSFDSSKKMHDASILTESLTLPGMRDSLDRASVGIQTESIEMAEPLSNGHESKKGNVNTVSFELNTTSSSSSSIKLKKILKNVKSDLEAYGKDKDFVLSDDICEIPETTSITPGYVGESDLSDNESSGKKQDGIDVDVQVISDDKDASDEDSDCIVEGSQKNNVTLERSLVKARPISLVASALVGREVAQVRHFAEAFNLHFSPQFNGFENTSDLPCTTHVVTKEDAGGKTFCTFKYLCGMISGCWIVSLKWVIDSLAANKILDEKPYEFLDASGNSKTYRELHGPKKLFKDFQFIYKEPFSVLTVQQLKDVIELGGGKIYGPESKPPQINRKYLAIADASVVDSSSGFCKFLFYEKIAVLSCEWVLECIEEYRILSISNYVLNIDYESDPLEICEKLLEMGYDKDLVTIEE